MYTRRQRLRYNFDNFMARGGSSIFTSLLLVFVVLIAVIFILRFALYALFPDAPSQNADDLFTNLYITFLQMTDPGNMALDIGSSAWYKIASVLSGMAGIVLLSALIAFITTALDQKLNDLRKGHSQVIEDGHTLIIGWSDRRIIEVLRELLEANESEENPCVVILSQRDKEFMDDFLKMYVPDIRNTRIVTRSGMESSLRDLNIAAVKTSKSCIILSDCNDSSPLEEKRRSDAKVMKSILAVCSALEERAEFNVVAEVFDSRYRAVAENISSGNIIVLDAQELLSKLLVQTSRSVGLSVVYNEALSFEGCEMYFYGAEWGNITFGQVGYHFEDGVPMGIRHEDGSLTINPSSDARLLAGDELLILAEDNDTIEYQTKPIAQPEKLSIIKRKANKKAERILIIGWSAKIKTIVLEYSDYVLENSVIDIIPRKQSKGIQENLDMLQKHVSNIKLNLMKVNPNSEKDLRTLSLECYDNIILLSPNVGDGEEERADAETILQLLLIRNSLRHIGKDVSNIKVITEILDSNNLELVSRAGVNDFIISNRFVSMLMAQISESKDIKRVYDDLFSEDGSEIYLKPVSLYFDTFPMKLTFASIMHAAQQRGETCIGVKLKEDEPYMDRNFGVTLNPNKNQEYTINGQDAFIVVSADET